MSTRNVEKRKKRRRRRKVKPKVKIVTAAVVIVLALGTYTGIRIYQNQNMADPFGDISSQDIEDDDSFNLQGETATCTVFDVGQGEAVLIKSGATDILVDTGPEDKADALCKALSEKVNGNIEYLVLSDAGPGRTGGVDKIMEKFSIDTCILGGSCDPDGTIRPKLAKCKEIVDGSELSYDIGSASTLFILNPEVSSFDERDRSLITYFTFSNTGFLLLSDAGPEEISRAFGDVNECNLVLLSRFGDTEANLAIPDDVYNMTAVASTADKASFPSEKLSSHLKGDIYATCNDGTMEFVSTGDSVELQEKPELEEDSAGTSEEPKQESADNS